MNRTQAMARLDQLLDWVSDAYLEGRCPRCEALWPAPDLGSPEDYGSRPPTRVDVPHTEGCPVGGAPEEIASLAQRFGFEFKEEVRPVPRLCTPRQLVTAIFIVRKT